MAILVAAVVLLCLAPAVRPARANGPLLILRVSDEGGTTPTLEPAMIVDDPWLIGLIFGGLVRLDANLRVVPDGADTWRISPDNRVYQFHIRPGLRLGDGTPVSAEDFAWSLNRALTPTFADGLAGFYLGDIKGAADVTSKKAAWVSGIQVLTSGPQKGWLQITLNQPSSVFLQQLAFPTSDVVPRARIARWGSAWTAQAVGTGPFMVKAWRPKQEIILVPNPYYWRGKLALSELHIELLSDAQQAFDLYHTGHLDVMGVLSFPSAQLVSAASVPGYHTQHLLLTDYLLPNARRAPFDKVAVRQAFSYAIDRQALADRALANTVFPATGILPPGMPGFTSHLHGQTYDPAQARHLLAQAGYPQGKGLPPVTLLVDNNDPKAIKVSTALQAAWQSVLGVHVTVARRTTYADDMSNHRFQIALATWAADYPDPQDALSLQLQTGAPNNAGLYSNALFDRLTHLADVMNPMDAQRYLLYQQAEQIAVSDAAWLVLDWGRSAVLMRPSVQGLVVTSWGIIAPNWTQVTLH